MSVPLPFQEARHGLLRRHAAHAYRSLREKPDRGAIFEFGNPRLARWRDADDLWLFGFWWWDWADQAVRVASIDVEGHRDGAWQELVRTPVMSGGKPPRDIDVDVAGCDRVKLVVTDAGDNIHADHTAWADARFVAR
jgi:hypothetical protein